MRRGPLPTPTATLEKRGSWLAKTRKHEPQAESGSPRCPSELDATSKAAWKYVTPLLRNMGVLCHVDRNALARYCKLWTRWRECERFIEEHGMVHPIKDKDGKLIELKEFPQVGRASKLSDQLLRLEQHFGMTPAARAAMGNDLAKTNSINEDKYFKLTG